MGKNTKAKMVNLYNIDLDEEYSKKKKSKTSNSTKKKKSSKKVVDNQINLDNEIIIGMKPIKEEKQKGRNKTKNKTKEKNKNATSKTNNKQKPINKKVNKKRSNKNIKKEELNKKRVSIVKWTVLMLCLLGAIIFFMMSPLFNIQEIQVINNSKLSSDTVISLSKINIGQNLFQINKIKIIQNIKQNAYVQDVVIKRKLPNVLQIEVQERKVAYMIEYGTSYAYLNNQGYILEINENEKAVPIITGHATSNNELFEGNRLRVEDLEKLDTVIKIVQTAASNDIAYLITKIDITDKQNYTLFLQDEKKTIYLGDASNISTRILYLKNILIRTSGKEGELFIDGDLNIEDVYFKEKII